jgi:hypothetical protein
MARGKRWTDAEVEVLMEMAAQGLSPQQIFDSCRLPDRSFDAIKKQMWISRSMPLSKPRTVVAAVQPAKDVLSIENAVKLFSTAFEQVCSLVEVDKLALERFRIIFQAAKDYGPLLAGYEKWENIEKQIEELKSSVEALQASRIAKDTPPSLNA